MRGLILVGQNVNLKVSSGPVVGTKCLDSSGMYWMSAAANLTMASVAGCSECPPHQQSNPLCRLNLSRLPCESKVFLALEWATWLEQCYVDNAKIITLTPQGPNPSLSKTILIKRLIPKLLPYKCLSIGHPNMGLEGRFVNN